MEKLSFSIALSNFILFHFRYTEEKSEPSKEKSPLVHLILEALKCQLTSGKAILIATCVATCSWPCRAAILILPLSRRKRHRDIFFLNERRQHRKVSLSLCVSRMVETGVTIFRTLQILLPVTDLFQPFFHSFSFSFSF